MPKGREFSQEIKRLIFHVIDFVQIEKYGEIIPLKNVDERLMKMLNISQRSVTRLKHELKEFNLPSLTPLNHLFRMVKTAGLYLVSFKRYKHFYVH